MRLVALQYHDVVTAGDFDASGFPGSAASTYKMSVERFAEHLDAIERSLHSPPAIVDGGAGLRRTAARQVVLSFDDGGRSAHERVADMLEARGWRGHFFVTTGCLGSPAFLAAAEARDLAERGHVVGSHSRTHPLRMAQLTAAQMADEWRSSVDALQDVLGRAVRVASVPGGYYARSVAESARDAGIEVLFTSEPTIRVASIPDCLIVGRFTLRRDSRPEVAGALARGKVMPRARQWVNWNLKKLLKRTAGDVYLRAREVVLR